MGAAGVLRIIGWHRSSLPGFLTKDLEGRGFSRALRQFPSAPQHIERSGWSFPHLTVSCDREVAKPDARPEGSASISMMQAEPYTREAQNSHSVRLGASEEEIGRILKTDGGIRGAIGCRSPLRLD
jgi:hypothetical protein